MRVSAKAKTHRFDVVQGLMYFVLFYFCISLVVVFFLLKFSPTWVGIWYLDFVKLV